MATGWATSTSARRPASIIARHIEFPFFLYYLKGRGDGKFPEGVRLSNRPEPVAQVRRVAAGRGEADHHLSGCQGQARLAAARRSRFRRISGRPEQARAVYRLAVATAHPEYLHDGRPALRRHAARRAGLQDRVLDHDVTVFGPDHRAI